MALVVLRQEEQEDCWNRRQQYDEKTIRQMLNRKKGTFLCSAVFSPEDKAVIGEFSVPKKRRRGFFSVGEFHYLQSCNEGTSLLIGSLAKYGDPQITRYMTYEGFLAARDSGTFRVAKIDDFYFRKPCRIGDTFRIRLRLEDFRKSNSTLYATVSIGGYVEGQLLYTALLPDK